jgi:hypothetical protein
MGSLFWGGLLILIGVQLLASALFGLDVPLFRIMFGVWIVYMGISLAFGESPWQWCSYSWKKEYTSRYHAHNSKSYSTIFGTQLLNFASGLDLQKDISVNTVCGTTHITLDPDIPVLINASATFGTVILPDKTQLSAGSEQFRNYLITEKPLYRLNINVVFGTVIVSFV